MLLGSCYTWLGAGMLDLRRRLNAFQCARLFVASRAAAETDFSADPKRFGKG